MSSLLEETATRPSPADSPGGIAGLLRTAWHLSWFGRGVEEPQPTPAELIQDEPHATITRVAPDPGQTGSPVLLVTPLAVPATCWDLRPGQSLAAHLSGYEAGQECTAAPGRPTYVIDYGEITFADRGMGFEDWVGEILPAAIRRISALHDGAPVHLVGWSHGGTISLLTAAWAPDLPLASLVALGTPTDYALNPTYTPLRWLDRRLGAGSYTLLTGLMGGVPARLTRLGYRWMAPVREITKPWSLLANLDDRETLARIEAVDRFIATMPGYPGRFFHQALTRIVVRRELARGRVRLRDDFVVEMDRLRVPILLIGSDVDVLALAPSVEAGVAAYGGSTSVAYLEVSGLSHFGLISSPRARQLTWPAITAHLAAHD